MAQKGVGLTFTVAAATLGLLLVVIWRVGHGSSSSPVPYVGKWKFISGEIKAGRGFPLSDKPAPDGTTTKPFAGNVAVVEVRDGVLWYRGDDRSCWYELHVGGGKAEVVPGGKVECDTEAPDAPKRTTSARMSMEIDAHDQAHISGEARASIDAKSERHEVTFTYDGIAVRETPVPKGDRK